MVALKAAELWPDIPAKGSIDDLPKTLDRSETIATIENAANAALAKPREEIAQSPSSTKEDEDRTTAKAISALLEKLLDATLAEDQPPGGCPQGPGLGDTSSLGRCCKNGSCPYGGKERAFYLASRRQ